MRQLVDWSAAVWAGVIAGTLLLLINLLVIPQIIGGNAWVVARLTASVVMGKGVLAPPATFEPLFFVVALLLHYALSIAYALVLAFITHRWGLIVGVLMGTLFGLALYAVNFYTLTFFFPWFYAMAGWPFAVAHVIFGATAGGVYESLEVEEFIST